jgi:chromosome segregation ATPase
MRSAPRNFSLLFLASLFLLAAAAFGQDDSPSLGDVARHARLQKAQLQKTDRDSSAASEKNGQSQDAPNQSVQTGDTTKPATDAISDSATKDGPPAKPTKRVITNDEISEHIDPTGSRPANSLAADDDDSGRESAPVQAKGSAEQWKAQIESAKVTVANLQQNINQLSASIQYAGANCVANCMQWNERQKQKQDQVESMKGQLESAEKTLEDLQDSARKQGFGTSVTDP